MTVPKKFIKKGICSDRVVADIFFKILSAEKIHDQEKEHFWVVGLTTHNNIKYIDLVSLGNLNTSLVHPREVFRFAIMQGVASIIIVHNHPSGDPDPSEEDLKITKRLYEGGKIIGIELLDHVIIGDYDIYMSFKGSGLIPFEFQTHNTILQTARFPYFGCSPVRRLARRMRTSREIGTISSMTG